MGVYEDGKRDCPGCHAEGFTHPNRIVPPVSLCDRCNRAATSDAATGLMQMEPFMRSHGQFADWLIQHGQPLA